MVWMTMLAALTGSSGLPANETRGQGGGGGSEWMSQPAQAGRRQIGRIRMHLDSCQLSCQERQLRTTVSKDITICYMSFRQLNVLALIIFLKKYLYISHIA